MNRWILAFGMPFVTGLVACSTFAQQRPPFFGGGGTAYDPEVGVINSGAMMGTQATVSADRKYVTINMQAANTRLQSLVPFPVVDANVVNGFVGGATFPGDTPASTRVAAGQNAHLPSAADQADRAGKSWILAREGMYFIKPLK